MGQDLECIRQKRNAAKAQPKSGKRESGNPPPLRVGVIRAETGEGFKRNGAKRSLKFQNPKLKIQGKFKLQNSRRVQGRLGVCRGNPPSPKASAFVPPDRPHTSPGRHHAARGITARDGRKQRTKARVRVRSPRAERTVRAAGRQPDVFSST